MSMALLLCLNTVWAAPSFPDYAGPGFAVVTDEATGYFHTERIGDRWWLINPRGEAFFLTGAGHVRFNGQGCERLGYSPYQAAAEARYGDEESWARETTARLREWGFNALTELHDPILEHRYAPHTAFQAFGYLFALKDGLPTPSEHAFAIFPNVFSPEWPTHCESLAVDLCARNAGDPWLIGYFIDNELQWFGMEHREWGLFNEAWKKPASDPAKQALIQFLSQRLEGPDQLLENWGMTVASWDDFARHTEPGPPLTHRARILCLEWLKLVAEKYFEGVVGAIRRHDPDHMILGVRFANAIPDILDVASRYCDVTSVNFYPRFTPGEAVSIADITLLNEWYEKTGKPLLISEWSFPALDSGLPCSIGAGMRVESQEQRARCWETFQETLFRLPFVVGSNYFAWSDEPALGISRIHPENTNYGLVDENDDPYDAIVTRAKVLNPRVYELRMLDPLAPSPTRGLGEHMTQAAVPLEATPPPHDTTTGALRMHGPGSTGLWTISFHDTPLGSVHPRLLQINKGYAWSVPNSVINAGGGSNDHVDMYDYVMTNAKEGMGKGEGAYRVMWRFIIPKQGKANWFGLQCLWVENIGNAPWRLLEAQLVMISERGEEKVGLSDSKWRPFYINGGYMWNLIEKLGIGATFKEPGDFNHYFKSHGNTGAMGELFHSADVDLAPGERWEPKQPALALYFLMQHDAMSHFAHAAGRVLEAVD